jgi:hypothetical protein
MANKAGVIHRVEGCIEVRRSPRFYTHAVVGEYDRASAVAHTLEWTAQQARDTWTYNEAKANAQPGQPVRFPHVHGRDVVLTFTAEEIEKAQEFLSNNPSLEAFLIYRKTDAVVRFCSTTDGQLNVLQWSQSERSAVKAAASKALRRGARHYRNVRVVKVQRG